MYENPEDEEKKHQDRIARLIFIALAFVIVAGAIVFLSVRRPAVGKKDGCPSAASAIPATVAIVLDATERYSPIQKSAIREILLREIDSLDSYTKVAVFQIDEGPIQDQITPRFQGCRPIHPSEASDLTHARKLVKKFYGKYKNQIDATIHASLNAPDAARSPIMEVLLGVGQWFDQNRAPHRELRLVLVSDLLQNSKLVSHYSARRPPLFQEFAQSQEYGHLKANLSRVEVVIFWPVRHGEIPEAVQGKAHVQFWSRYFQDAGAILIESTPLPGGALGPGSPVEDPGHD